MKRLMNPFRLADSIMDLGGQLNSSDSGVKAILTIQNIGERIRMVIINMATSHTHLDTLCL